MQSEHIVSEINVEGKKERKSKFPAFSLHVQQETFSSVTLPLLTRRWDRHGNRPERASS